MHACPWMTLKIATIQQNIPTSVPLILRDPTNIQISSLRLQRLDVQYR
jgi:hypothetical protein